MAQRPLSLTETLLSELECPVCLEYMVPPILLCQQGHNICSSCKPKLQHCPNCRCNFLQTRNFSMENVSRLIEVPCKNRRSGCLVRLTADVIGNHEQDCEFNPMSCPVQANGKTCPWKGLLNYMREHIIEEHPGEFSEDSGSITLIKKFGNKNENYNGVIFAHGEIFQWHLGCAESYLHMLQGFVRLVGAKKNALDYSYEFVISKPGDVQRMSFRHKTHCHDELKEHILREKKCLKTEYNVAIFFLDENGQLHAELNISKI